LCTGGHSPGGFAESRVPKHVDHPEVALVNRIGPEHPDYMPLFDDQGRPSPTGTVSCPTCHQTHAASKSVPSHHMFLRTNHQTLCADCHGMEAPWRFLYYHRDSRKPLRQHPANAPAGELKKEAASPEQPDR
jgi:hypothetical protein